MYSLWSTNPLDPLLWIKLNRVSTALRASSWVGDVGVDITGVAVIPLVTVVEVAMLLLLLLWCKCGEEIVVSRPKGAGCGSWAGDSKADAGTEFDGSIRTVESCESCWFMSSTSSVGNVWLLGRENLEDAATD